MKLYTEEVLRNSMNSVKYYMEHYDASVIDSIIEKHIKALGPIKLPDYEKVTRFEVIDHTSSKEGRILVRYSVMVDVSIQDEGMTMKVFLTDKYQS